MAEVKLTAELRTEFGKGAARRIRRADKVPAVLYGHGSDPQHITLPGHATLMALREHNALLSIEVDGKSQLALPKQIQRDPIKGFIEHVDLVMVRRGEKVTVDVTLHSEGETAPDTVAMWDRNDVAIEAEATNIPEGITISVEGLDVGAQIHASDLELPEGSTLAVDPDTLIVSVSAARSAAEEEEEAAAAEGEETEGEGEGEESGEDSESDDSES
ncbi:50S ribosomal protein L25/general stress protein Ctc [Microlunatus soli]|uniref:Large ribosomal subunit protein bL25 n=1 Tax=Microlunatus soli TaxID=630515 RepID=A0A1H1QYU1_9ACTN|nr:50S ribosomal protein L25/general stress protein Ctc [Microlunatus soli]SDS28526.1 large subunit ribosomal protein L25 [Microlunatus soli]